MVHVEYTLMPCPFTGPKMFWAGPSFFVPYQKSIFIVAVANILCQTKWWFAFSKIGFCAGLKVFEETVKFLSWLKKFGPAPFFVSDQKSI